MRSKGPDQPRAPLTTEELARLTADDFARIKLTHDEIMRLRELNTALERDRQDRATRFHAEQVPIVSELAGAGIQVEYLSDLIMRRTPYPAAVPILLKHLMLTYSDVTRETIARALAVPDARYAWSILVEQYRRAPVGKGIRAPGDAEERPLGAKSGLAVALAATASEATMDELIALAKDPSQGDSRVLLLRPIRRWRHPSAKHVIEYLARDPALSKEISSWNKRDAKKR